MNHTHYGKTSTRGAMAGAVLGVLAAFSASPASADEISDFYEGKTVEIYVGFSAGGGYDIYARLLANHIGKHIPGNPDVIVKNMTGAGSVALANWLYGVAPKDGTVFGTIARGVPLDPLFGNPGPQFENSDDLNYVGSANQEVSVCIAKASAGVTQFSDLMDKELVVGGFGAGTESEQHVKLLNAVMGTKFKLVKGYPGGNDVNMAIENGEVDGRCGWSWTSVKATYTAEIESGDLLVLVQNAVAGHPDIPEVPVIVDIAETQDQKQMLNLVLSPQIMGRPFMAPPGIPEDRLDALQQAFMDTMEDPDFLKEAESAKLEISPLTGDEMKKVYQEAYATSPELVKKLAEALE
ncbi:tripartite tricarboxylate transporter substrate-binding protein [Mesorhizobium sp. CAU 1741]|uniref:Bug family tripartite tricarboxylate transporter substrate binding protein n=1 Tax=Mesorhizobium sp. CAU 1741 TaxID=3140366 RepID=UPI00325B876F